MLSDQSQVLNMRIKGALSESSFDMANLYYLSLHTLDSPSGNHYAKSRVSRDLLDAWMAKKISFGGQKFDDEDITLTDQDWATTS